MTRIPRITARLVFLFTLALLSCGVTDCPQVLADDPPKVDGPRAAYFPKVTLHSQDGKENDFYEDLIMRKIVLLKFIYTRSDDKLWAEGTKNRVRCRKAPGARLAT